MRKWAMHRSASSPNVKKTYMCLKSAGGQAGSGRIKPLVKVNYSRGVGFQIIFLEFCVPFCLAFYQLSNTKIHSFSNQTQRGFYFKGKKELKTEVTGLQSWQEEKSWLLT